MDTSTMISGLAATGHVPMSIAQVGDLLDIDHRAKYGDESGWRGDISMNVCINTTTGWFEIWGLDNRRQPYLAASHHALDHTLIVKLRDGDPRKHDVMQRVMDANAKMKADQEQADREKFAEIGEKIQHAILKEFHGRRSPVTVERKMST